MIPGRGLGCTFLYLVVCLCLLAWRFALAFPLAAGHTPVRPLPRSALGGSVVKARVLPSDAAAPAEDGGPPTGDGDRYLSIGDDAQDRDQRCRAWLQEPRASLTLTLNLTLTL